MPRWTSAALLVIALAAPARGDTPLPPPQDWQGTTATGVAIAGDLASGTTTIGPPGGGAWTIGRFVHPDMTPMDVAPDGSAVLVYHNTLVAWDDPDMIVLQVYHRDGAPRPGHAISAVTDHAALPPTASHRLWDRTVVWAEGGWRLTQVQGGSWFIDAGTGALHRIAP